MNVGILGSGLMGGKLGTLLSRAGHDVVFSYSRSQEKLRSLARDAGGRARAGTPRETAQAADVRCRAPPHDEPAGAISASRDGPLTLTAFRT